MARWFHCPKCGKTFEEHTTCSCGTETEGWVRICGEAFPIEMIEGNEPFQRP